MDDTTKYDSNVKEIELRVNISQTKMDYLKGLERWEKNSKEGKLCGKIFPESDKGI